MKDDGLLVILTPDSKAAHANSQVMKSWRTALSFLGLKRIAYEKLLHVHCMAFRKSKAKHSYAWEEWCKMLQKVKYNENFLLYSIAHLEDAESL